MLGLLLGLLPLALAAAVSPVMLTEQVVILGSPGGRRAAWSYAAGTAVVLGLVVALVVSVGQTLSLPQAPRLSASLDLLVGAVLLGAAAALHVGRRAGGRRTRPPRQRRDLSPVHALGLGAFSMATNVTSLALVVPAAKDVAASRQGDLAVAVAAVLLVAVVCLPAWAPVALTSLAPGPAGRSLSRLHDLLDAHGRTLVVGLLAGGGAYLLVRGVVRLLLGGAP